MKRKLQLQLKKNQVKIDWKPNIQIIFEKVFESFDVKLLLNTSLNFKDPHTFLN